MYNDETHRAHFRTMTFDEPCLSLDEPLPLFQCLIIRPESDGVRACASVTHSLQNRNPTPHGDTGMRDPRE